MLLAGLAQPGSNRGYRPRQLITQFMRSVWCGANRFEQGEVKRHDPVLKRLFGFKRMTYFKAVMRLFNTFTQGTNESVMDSLYRWMYGQLSINAWSKPRWVVGIRQHIERRAAPKGKTLNLFADDPVTGQWRFSARVTDVDLPAEAIWRIYRGRADCENRIKELKYDFAADSLNMKAFGATEARLNTVLLAYNLMSLLRQVLLKTGAVKQSSTSVQHTLQTVREARLHHHRPSQAHLESGAGDATANRFRAYGMRQKPLICPPKLPQAIRLDEVLMENLGLSGERRLQL